MFVLPKQVQRGHLHNKLNFLSVNLRQWCVAKKVVGSPPLHACATCLLTLQIYKVHVKHTSKRCAIYRYISRVVTIPIFPYAVVTLQNTTFISLTFNTNHINWSCSSPKGLAMQSLSSLPSIDKINYFSFELIMHKIPQHSFVKDYGITISHIIQITI